MTIGPARCRFPGVHDLMHLERLERLERALAADGASGAGACSSGS